MANSEKEGFKIKAFCCQQSAFEAYEMAKTMKLPVPDERDIVKVKCTGLIDIIDVMQAFEDGADGIMVVACHEGNCLFLSGNSRAVKRVQRIKKLLDEIGIGGERLEIFHVAANMGPRFSEITTNMKDRISKLGKSPIK
jgi:coenzyme F420-reducing hydrogenase delta subunit